MAADNDRALVLLSGGQDSTTCLYWAINRFGVDAVTALSFDYGQRHRIELDCAANVAMAAGIDHFCLPIDTFAALGGDALTDMSVDVDAAADTSSGLPNTFVPGRNLIFLTYAAAFAYRRGIRHLVTGVAQTDYSGYPDCREHTLRSLEETLRLGMEYEFTMHAPLMHRSKKATVELAESLGVLPVMAMTHTCYEGQRPPCGVCAACRLRAKGFAAAGVADPLVARS
ncbi:MAG: 7-cyano-7-deazaguanine synthase QueC [Gammaproteobacteria bacterium]|nr:7-cyano-7-deazaguanine synthase QueC [Gammaproteobacteria bacterium]